VTQRGPCQPRPFCDSVTHLIILLLPSNFYFIAITHKGKFCLLGVSVQHPNQKDSQSPCLSASVMWHSHTVTRQHFIGGKEHSHSHWVKELCILHQSSAYNSFLFSEGFKTPSTKTVLNQSSARKADHLCYIASTCGWRCNTQCTQMPHFLPPGLEENTATWGKMLPLLQACTRLARPSVPF